MDSFILVAALLIPAYLLNAFFGFKQMKRFGKEYSEMRRNGRVAIGRQAGKIASGSIVMFSLDENGVIFAGRKLQGTTVIAKFKDFNILNGQKIDSVDLQDEELTNEIKNTQKAVSDAVNNYNLHVNGLEIPEKKAPLSRLGDSIKNLFNKNKEEAK